MPRAIADVEAELTTLAAHLSAATYRLLELIAEFDSRAGWSGIGLKSCAHWLTWKCGIGPVAAREKVRVAHALSTLPAVSDAMRRGALSYSKVRAMTRVATPANEQSLLAIALNGTALHVERTVHLYRRTGRALEHDIAAAQYRDRELSYYFDEDGSFVMKARLPAEQGARIVKALQAADEALHEDASAEAPCRSPNASAEATPLGEAPARADWRTRQADALTLLAETLLAHGAHPDRSADRHLVHVHVNANALQRSSDVSDVQCHLEDGPALARDTARRLTCNASLVVHVENGEGKTLDVGRKTRAIPPALRRALAHRDRGCRFPGCPATRFVDAHHIEHWADGGETKLRNLVLLCTYHHTLMHEGGFELRVEGGGLRFVRADGRVVESAPRAEKVVGDASEALQRKHRAGGIEIDERTGVPGWGGERADYGYLIAMLDDRDRCARPGQRFRGSD
jgi:hypothetical protein